MPVKVVARDLAKSYEEEVFSRVDLELGPGLYLLVGDNGTGKTTLMSILAGVIPASEGRVERPARVSLCLAESSLFPELTVQENLDYYARLYGHGSGPSAPAWWVVRGLKLEPRLNTRVGSLSTGWRKRADLARALCPDPELVLLDEAFSGLDTGGIQELIPVLQRVSGEKVVILSSPVEVSGPWKTLVLKEKRLWSG